MRANEVQVEQDVRRTARMSAMRPILTQIERKIRQQASHGTNTPYILFDVPSFVFGYPLYTMKEAMEYLIQELSRAGYWVWNVEDRYLFISWLKPVKSKELGKPILTTNYRPMPYSASVLPPQ